MNSSSNTRNPSGFSLCFQNFDKELAGLPGDYAPPEGRLLLAEYEASTRRLRRPAQARQRHLRDEASLSAPAFRGKGLGRALADRIIAEARQIGYQRMRLDTVEPVMKDAVAMYRKIGFREIAPYRANPMAGALYMELVL